MKKINHYYLYLLLFPICSLAFIFDFNIGLICLPLFSIPIYLNSKRIEKEFEENLNKNYNKHTYIVRHPITYKKTNFYYSRVGGLIEYVFEYIHNGKIYEGFFNPNNTNFTEDEKNEFVEFEFSVYTLKSGHEIDSKNPTDRIHNFYNTIGFSNNEFYNFIQDSIENKIQQENLTDIVFKVLNKIKFNIIYL